MKTRSNIRFIPGNSIVYKINPIVKGIICFACIMFFTLSNVKAYGLLAMLLLISILCKFFGIKQLHIWSSISQIGLLLVIVGVCQGFRNNTFDVLFALSSMERIIGVFVSAGIYITISSQSELLYFWENLFMPLRFVGLPAKELALIMVIAIRFFPVILSEIDRIRMAQVARGAKLQKKGIFSSAFELMPLLIPTLSQSILRANDLADAMEARGYRVAASRTRYTVFEFGIKDCFFVLFTASVLTLVTLIGI